MAIFGVKCNRIGITHFEYLLDETIFGQQSIFALITLDILCVEYFGSIIEIEISNTVLDIFGHSPQNWQHLSDNQERR